MNDIFCPQCFAVLCDMMNGHLNHDEAEQKMSDHGDQLIAERLKNGFVGEYYKLSEGAEKRIQEGNFIMPR